MTADEILSRVTPSAGRRWFGVAVLAGLAAILVWIAMSGEAPLGWRLFFFVVAGGAVMLADRMRRIGVISLELTRDELRTSEGEVLARVTDVTRVDRGAFAFKPSNGFLVHLSTTAPARWMPGLWWRQGKRLGIGGMLRGSETRAMAEILTALITGVLPDDA